MGSRGVRIPRPSQVGCRSVEKDGGASDRAETDGTGNWVGEREGPVGSGVGTQET